MEPTDVFDLTCKQFRHAGVAEAFEVLICPLGQHGYHVPMSGCLEVVVEAANLSELVVRRVPLRLARKSVDTLALIEAEVLSL